MRSSIPQRGFSQSEFEQRAQKAQRIMNEEKLDAILLTTEPNVRYFNAAEISSVFLYNMAMGTILIIPKNGKIQLTLTFDIVRYLSAQSIVNDHNTTGWFA